MTTACAAREWHECPDIVRKVLATLSTLQDYLNCDLVCKSWHNLQVPVPADVCIRIISPAQKAWLRRNACRVLHMNVETTYPSSYIEQEVFPYLCMGGNKVSLVLKNCLHLTHLPDCIKQLGRLQTLRVCSCPHFQALPESLGSLTSLHQLEICAPPPGIDMLAAEGDPAAQDGPTAAAAVPTDAPFGPLEAAVAAADLINFPSVAGMTRCCALRRLPDSIGGLVNLRVLIVKDCPFLQYIPESIGQLNSLTKVSTAHDAVPAPHTASAAALY